MCDYYSKDFGIMSSFECFRTLVLLTVEMCVFMLARLRHVNQ